MDDEVISELKKFLGRFKETRGAVISLAYIDELEQQVESLTLSLANNELQISELRQRCEAMASYLRTHDHRLHDAAMAAAKEH